MRMQHVTYSSCIGQSSFRRGDETDVDWILTICDTTWGGAQLGQRNWGGEAITSEQAFHGRDSRKRRAWRMNRLLHSRNEDQWGGANSRQRKHEGKDAGMGRTAWHVYTDEGQVLRRQHLLNAVKMTLKSTQKIQLPSEFKTTEHVKYTTLIGMTWKIFKCHVL